MPLAKESGTGLTERSSGHLAFDSKFEYLVYEGEVYRAPLDCPIRADVPIRNGARWFARSIDAAQRIFDSYPEHLRFPEGGPTVDQTILPLAVSDQEGPPRMRRLRRASFVTVYWLLERTPVGRAILITEWGKGWECARRLRNSNG